MGLKGWRLAWYWLGLASLLGWVSIPFLWRTGWLLKFLLVPVAGISLPGMLILGCILLFGQRQIRLFDFALVSFALLLAVWFTTTLGDEAARRWTVGPETPGIEPMSRN